MRYQFSDYEWIAIKPMLPNKPRGVRRANDRRVLNGILWVLRSGAPWRDLPGELRPLALNSSRPHLSISRLVNSEDLHGAAGSRRITAPLG